MKPERPPAKSFPSEWPLPDSPSVRDGGAACALLRMGARRRARFRRNARTVTHAQDRGGYDTIFGTNYRKWKDGLRK